MSCRNKARRGNAGWRPVLGTRSSTSSSSGLSSIYQIFNISAAERYFEDSTEEPLVPAAAAGCCNFWSNYIQSRIVIGSYNEMVGAWHNVIQNWVFSREEQWTRLKPISSYFIHIYRKFQRYIGAEYGSYHFEKHGSWTGAECLRNSFRSQQFDSHRAMLPGKVPNGLKNMGSCVFPPLFGRKCRNSDKLVSAQNRTIRRVVFHWR